MDNLPMYLSLIPFLLVLLYFAYKAQFGDPDNLPPGKMGFPIFGESLNFLLEGHEKFVLRRMKKYTREVFKTRIFGHKTAILCGPKATEFLFANDQTIFAKNRLHRTLHSHDEHGDPADEECPKPSPRFLIPEAMDDELLNAMEEITQSQISKFCEGNSEVMAFSLAKMIAMTMACRFFLGSTIDNEKIARLVRNYDDLIAGMRFGTVDFSGLVSFWGGRAVYSIRKELKGLIKSEKAKDEDEDEDVTMEDEEADEMMKCLGEGYVTAVTAIAFFFKYVGERPDVYAKILAEQKRVLESKNPGEALQKVDIVKMKYSWNAIKEVLRLTPPIQGTSRKALTDFKFAGYTVPKGWKVYWSAMATNKNPKYFPNPEKFNPSRYRGTRIFPHLDMVHFGGGHRKWAVKEFARLTSLTFVHSLVKRFKWDLLYPQEKVTGDVMPTPEKGFPVRLRPR